MSVLSPVARELAIAPERFREGEPIDGVCGIDPRHVATPQTIEEVVALATAARTQRLALLAVGGRTLVSMGNAPQAVDVLVETGALNAVVETCPADMIVTIEAGATLGVLNRVLSAHSQRLALDCDAGEVASIGGLVAANAAGGLAYGFGTPRELVLGMTVVDGRGRTLHLGGRVVKNVAGYDLVRLFAGSFGTLGIIVQLTMRTHPLPAAAVASKIVFESSGELDRARAAIFVSELPLSAFDMNADAAVDGRPWEIVVLAEGSEREVDEQRRRCRELAVGGTVTDIDAWHSPFHPRADNEIVMRMSTLPDRTVAVARRLSESAPWPVRVAGRLGDGTLRVFTRADDDSKAVAYMRAVRAAAVAEGSACVVERMPLRLRRDIDAWGDPPASLPLMRALKARFDPERILAPGRFVGGL